MAGESTVLQARVEKLLRTGDYHDFVLKCGGEEFKVHRNIICPVSEVLAALTSNAFKEGHDGFAALEDITDPGTLRRALDFIYTDKYTEVLEEEESTCIEDGIRMVFNVKVFLFADYLNINSLKSYAVSKLQALVSKETINDPGFAIAIREVFQNTNQDEVSLRKPILELCADHIEIVTRNYELTQILDTSEPVAWSSLRDCRLRLNEMSKDKDFLDAEKEILESKISDLQHEIVSLKLQNAKL